MEIKLKYRVGDTETVEVKQEDIVEAAVIEYRGDYFIFSGMAGKFYTEVIFEQCNPPVKVD